MKSLSVNSRNQDIQPALTIGLAVLLFIGLYFTSAYNYLLFHTVAELFSVLIAWMVFILAWNSRRFLNHGYLLFLGISMLFVGCLDLVHTLAYKDMPIFQGYDTNLPTQLWIAARYMQSLSLLLATAWIRRPLRTAPVLAGFSLVTLILLGSIFAGIFPDCYMEDSGLTPFKIFSEYLINAILAISLILLYRNRAAFNGQLLRFMTYALLASIASELAFTLYFNVEGLANLIGHFLKIVAFYFIYKAIIETGFAQTFGLLLHDLQKREAELEVSQARLEQANRDLQAAVLQAEQRSVELEAVFGELQQAQAGLREHAERLEASNRELEQFASVASHDMQEPLRKVTAFGQRLQDSLGDRLDETERLYLDRMISAAARMQVMIDALLSYARVTTKGKPYEAVDLQQTVREVLADLEARLDQTHGLVEVDPLPVVEADPVQMRQLFQNLLGNALKFHRRDVAPVIRVSGELVHPEGNDGQSGGRVTIRVEDNGIGIEPEHLERIFRPFERLHGRSEYEGTGMGLAICQKIVERHSGTIKATSTPGQGTTFVVSLPARQTRQVPSPAEMAG